MTLNRCCKTITLALATLVAGQYAAAQTPCHHPRRRARARQQRGQAGLLLNNPVTARMVDEWLQAQLR